jgi:hypothetical protein
MWFDMNVLILIEKVNKNYRLPFERAHRRVKLKNHTFRKESSGGVKEQPGLKSSTQKSLLPLFFTYFIVNRTAKNPSFNLSFLS